MVPAWVVRVMVVLKPGCWLVLEMVDGMLGREGTDRICIVRVILSLARLPACHWL